jgi:hypothetical protein
VLPPPVRVPRGGVARNLSFRPSALKEAQVVLHPLEEASSLLCLVLGGVHQQGQAVEGGAPSVNVGGGQPFTATTSTKASMSETPEAWYKSDPSALLNS